MKIVFLNKRGRIRYGIVLILVWIWAIGIGEIEGYFFPTADPMVLTKQESGDNILRRKADGTVEIIRTSLFWGTSVKHRAGQKYPFFHSYCLPKRPEFFLGLRRNGGIPIRIEWGPPKYRHDGEFEFGPWSIDATERVFLDYVFGDIVHQCYTFGIPHPWETRIHFWN
jgi:hypothetical protein